MDDIPLPAPQPSLRPPTGPRRRSRLSHALSILAVASFLAGLAALAWYLPHRNATQRTASPFGRGPGGARNTTTVALTDAKLADIPVRLEALGTVTPLAVATVHPQVSGILSDVFYKEGQQVKRGEVLAAIDPRPFQIALDQANGSLERDEAELSSAKVTLDRDNALLEQELIAQQDVDTQARDGQAARRRRRHRPRRRRGRTAEPELQQDHGADRRPRRLAPGRHRQLHVDRRRRRRRDDHDR